jgi:hypothetical protein
VRGRSFLVVAMLVACGRREPAPAPIDRARDAATNEIPATDAPTRGGADDPLAEKLRHCPITVDGVAIALRDVDDGVEWTITATDAAAIDEIRRRAAHLVAFTSGQPRRGEHGGGAGGGFMQNCPVVARSTTIEATDIPGGSRLVVRAGPDLTAPELRAETRRRHAALTAP